MISGKVDLITPCHPIKYQSCVTDELSPISVVNLRVRVCFDRRNMSERMSTLRTSKKTGCDAM